MLDSSEENKYRDRPEHTEFVVIYNITSDKCSETIRIIKWLLWEYIFVYSYGI